MTGWMRDFAAFGAGIGLVAAAAGCSGGRNCEELLACEDEVVVACSGPETPADVPDPSLCADADVESTEAAGYPVGETPVSFSAVRGDASATCVTTVRVVDEEPPQLACPASLRAVRRGPGVRVYPPTDRLGATDRCTDALEFAWEPADLVDRETVVTFTARDAGGNEASCETRVEVLDLFPATDLRILSASLGGAGQTAVVLGWEPSLGGDVAAYRIERGAAEVGPWDEVGAVGAATQVFTDPDLPAEGAWYRVVPTGGGEDGPATRPVRAWAIGDAAYHERRVDVPGVPFQTDLFGLVRHPADLDGGPYPLVLLLHGNHGNCRLNGTTTDFCAELPGHECTFAGYSTAPNADGMVFQAETLAAQGMIAVSLSANALNCRNNESGYIGQRAEYVLENLRRWKAWHEGEDGPLGTTFAGAVDLSRVGLVGHSRGGDAVANVPRRLILTPIDGVEVRSIFAIAPTDILRARVGDAHYGTLLPACDGDVVTLDGAAIHDRSINDPHLRAQVFYVGANHNFFNTEWTDDDGALSCPSSARLPERPHTAMLEATLGAWFAGTLTGSMLEPALRAEAPTPTAWEAWAGRDLDLRWSYHAPGVSLIDRFDVSASPGVNRTGGANRFDGFTDWGKCFGRFAIGSGGCGTPFLHAKHAVFLAWDDGASAVARFELADLDASGFGALSFRVVSRVAPVNDGRTEQVFAVRLIDADGVGHEVAVDALLPIPHAYEANQVREVLQTVRLPLGRVRRERPELDLGRLAALELVFGADGAPGSVTVTDVELAD
jgi:hypothetical protein